MLPAQLLAGFADICRSLPMSFPWTTLSAWPAAFFAGTEEMPMTRSATKSQPEHPSAMRIPGSWNREAHRLYLAGRLEEAVNLALRDAGMHVERFVQAMYYVYMHGDYRAGLVFCREFLKRRPGDVEMLNNACACCTNLGKYREAVGYAESVLAIDPDNADACGILAHAYGRLQDMTKAREAGTRALVLKDRAVLKTFAETAMHQPAGTEAFLREARQKKSVCAFSLSAPTPAAFAAPSTTSLSLYNQTAASSTGRGRTRCWRRGLSSVRACAGRESPFLGAGRKGACLQSSMGRAGGVKHRSRVPSYLPLALWLGADSLPGAWPEPGTARCAGACAPLSQRGFPERAKERMAEHSWTLSFCLPACAWPAVRGAIFAKGACKS